MSKNDITGDEIKSKPSNKEYEDGYDRIFRNKPKTDKPLESCPNYPDLCFCTGECKHDLEL